MAFFTPKFPLSNFNGPFGKIDRTIKAGTGLAVKIVKRNGKWSLEQKTAATTTNSPSKQEWADKYFKCDCKWKKLSPACRLEIQKTQREIGSKYEKTLPIYHYFMRYCLYGTECDKYLFYNCLSTYASFTDEGSYLDVRGLNLNGICNLKSRLILNGEIYEEKITGNDGHVQYNLNKSDLAPGQNIFYIQICFKLSSPLYYTPPGAIKNGDFETGDLTDWENCGKHPYGFYVACVECYPGWPPGKDSRYAVYVGANNGRYGWIRQTVNLTGINSITFDYHMEYRTGGSRLAVGFNTLGDTKWYTQTVSDWREGSIDTTAYDGDTIIYFYAYGAPSWGSGGVFDNIDTT